MAITPFVRQLGIVVATLCVGFSAGASLGFPSVLLYQLRMEDSEFTIDLDTASWMGSIHGLAGTLGVIAPVVMQWRGRKFTFIAACLILISGWVLAFAANSVATILMSECVLGFGASVLLTVSYDTLSEMITPSYRNVAGQSYCTINSLGIAIAGVMTRFLHWRILSIILCLPAIVSVLISLTWLESPLWLAYKENLEQCETNFIKIRGTDEHSMKELREVIAAQKEKKSRKMVSKRDKLVKRIWHQVSARDFIIPAIQIILLLNHVYWSGTSVVLIYSVELISKATQNDSVAFIGAIVINFVYFISSSLSNVLVRCFDNKTVLMFGTCGTSVCLLCTSIVTYLQSIGTLPNDSLLSLYFLLGYIITTSSGQVPVEVSISAELMPVKHRGLGGALFVITACFLNALALKVSPYLFVYLGLWGTFLVFTLNSAVCGFLIWKYVPETKGKTLQEIECFYAHETIKLIPSNEEKEPLKM